MKYLRYLKRLLTGRCTDCGTRMVEEWHGGGMVVTGSTIYCPKCHE